MGKPRRDKAALQKLVPPAARANSWDFLSGWRWVFVLAVIVLAFYWTPLTSSTASIQWDAVDVHYSSQKYFADRLWSHELPHWTPYVFTGFPFLADPQVGAWYPLNWPFFLNGISPRDIEAELALHALLACAGAFLLFRKILQHPTAALGGALAYGLSGFFAGHSSHVGIFSAAALLPWLLLCFREALDTRPWRYTALGGLVGGSLILAGHFQTALYSFAVLFLFAIAEQVRRPAPWRRAAVFLVLAPILAVLISAVGTLPGLELAGQSIRAGSDYGTSREGVLEARALTTLVYPNALGAFSDEYKGPSDITQYYFYAGILLLPLAVLGLWNQSFRIPTLLLVLVPLWYMAGPAAGLYRIGAILPGLHRVRAPVNGWFVVTLGLALLAACGIAQAASTWKWRHTATVVVAVLALDLCWFNSWTNPLAYARLGFDELYGRGEQKTARLVASTQAPLTRFHAQDKLAALGPMNHPLDLRLEATYGYNPLGLSAYADYRAAIQGNPNLLAGMNASRQLDVSTGRIVPIEPFLARASIPPSVIDVSSLEESRRLLAKLNPSNSALVQTPHPPIQQDPNASASVEPVGEQGYRIRYRAASPSLLRVVVPYFPGWCATLNGASLDVLRVDHAFLGVVVPAGEGELTLRFEPRRFQSGGWLSVLGLLFAAGLLGADFWVTRVTATGSGAWSAESK